MKKWLIAAGVLVVALVVLIVVGVSNLGPIIKEAVNTRGPRITGTVLEVGDVDISPFSGRASLQDFLLGNPTGFDAPYAVSVGTIKVDVDEKSLTGDTIIIDSIEVVAPRITFEQSRSGDNFKALLRNVRQSAGSGGQSAGQGSEEGGKKLLIRDFLVRDGQVKLAVQGLKGVKGLEGREISATLPEIHLRDIGGQQGGATPAQVAREIVAALYGKVTSTEVQAALRQKLSEFDIEVPDVQAEAGKAVESAREKAAEEAQSAGEKLKGLFDR